MHFVYAPPWWLTIVLVSAIGTLIHAQYRRPLAPLTKRQRTFLGACRALALGLLVVFLLRPAALMPPAHADAIVPILVDGSRSMRLNDADGQSRLAAALSVLTRQLLPDLSKQFVPEIFKIGERVEPTTPDRMAADGAKSDLRAALTAINERYRGQRVTGIVLLSDGADTGSSTDDASDSPPVFAVGFGSSESTRDREVSAVVASDQSIDETRIDLRVSASSAGFGRTPFELRVLANGSEVERRRVVPQSDYAPAEEVFAVAPDPARPTVYTAEIAVDGRELVPENNRRSVLVNPAGRRRRLLVMVGAPGFEHSFMTRAWLRDPGLEVDVVGRKGRDVEGKDTFFVQAPAARTEALGRGFPAKREDLYAYDGLVLANVDGDALEGIQLTSIAEFVSERGGGLLVVGSRSFASRGLAGTVLENVLPVELSDRRNSSLAKASEPTPNPAAPNKLVLTPAGGAHALMRIGATAEETRRLWSALPPLASTVPLGDPRPGATVLGVAMSPTGVSYPVVAVQRFGRGRSMSFSGEASWRWKMLLPSTDRSFDTFWRQAARWITSEALDRVALTVPENPSPGDTMIAVDVRDLAFAPVGDAVLTAVVTSPGGESRSPQWRSAENGRYIAHVQADAPGLYHIRVEAMQGRQVIGTAERWMYVGGVDPEFAAPRLNDAWLRRIATASGGRYVRSADASRIAEWLSDFDRTEAALERRELWHEPWAFAIVTGVLSVEWILRRRWGLR